MVKNLHPQPIYGPEDTGSPISMNVLQSTITRVCHDMGLSVEVTLEEMREGGMFSKKFPCILVRHKNFKTSYLQHVIVQKPMFNSSQVFVYLAGKSHNLFKMGVGDEAYGQWGTRARIFGVTKGEVGSWLPSLGELILGHAGKKAAQKFHNQEKPYYERVEYAIGFAIGESLKIAETEPITPPTPPTVPNKVNVEPPKPKVDTPKAKVEPAKPKVDTTKVKADYSKPNVEPPKVKTVPPKEEKHYSRKIIGIDLGTTNSCVSVMEGGAPVMIPSQDGGNLTASVVAFDKNGKRFVGMPAKRQAAINTNRTVSSIKRQMGSAYRLPVDGQMFSPEQLSAMILSKLKADAESYLGENVKKAVITVPAYFTNQQRQATKDAGEIAGLEVVRIINEPTAAAMAYGLNNEKNQKVMVYDLGGGTFDVSILDMGDGMVEVLATSGDNHLGGDDFDRCLVDLMIETFRKENGIDLFGNLVAMQRMKEAAEKAKIELSTQTRTEISLPYIYSHESRGAMHLSLSVTRSQFDEMIADMVSRTQDIVRQALADAQLTPADISKVLLVGGSTRVPAVQAAIQAVMGNKLVKQINPDECVAKGAAVQGGILNGDLRNVILLDVIPVSLGLETKGGVFGRIVPKNTTIPTSVTQLVTTTEDNQTSVKISVYQGEEKHVSDNKLLGHFVLGDIQPKRQGTARIQVRCDVGTDGILNVSAKDLDTGKENSITIFGSDNMSRNDIDKAIMDVRRYESANKMV